MESVNANLLIIKSPGKATKNENESNRSYQKRIRLIAYLNIVYFSIWLPFFLMIVLTSIWSTAFYMEVEIPQAIRPFPNLTNTVNFVYVWSVVILFGMEVICQLIASFFLLSSTELDAYIQPAMIQAQVWRNVTIGYTIANILNAMIAPQISFYYVTFLSVRIYMIYIVQKYIKQMEKQSWTTGTNEVYVKV